MKIINASYEILPFNKQDIYYKIERMGRLSYVSDSEYTEETGGKFIQMLINHGHESVLEHASLSVIFTVDRGVSHELVRHRLASFTQESTRYCNYSKGKFGNEITVIEPCFFEKNSDEYKAWHKAMDRAEDTYFWLLDLGKTPQEARDVLPTSLKTCIGVTTDMREWRHILSLRAAGTTGTPHPQMAEVMVPLLDELNEKMPELFGDIWKIKEERIGMKCLEESGNAEQEGIKSSNNLAEE